jgi:dTDP-D-glucose 4,6-dehydratase
MKYTLINGGAGFIGSRIVEKFNKKEIKINLKLLQTQQNTKTALSLKPVSLSS